MLDPNLENLTATIFIHLEQKQMTPRGVVCCDQFYLETRVRHPCNTHILKRRMSCKLSLTQKMVEH